MIERFEHVWTCLGDPVFDLPHPPEIGGLELEWRAAEPIHAECGFMAATENFRDMAHFPFVHAPSMGEVNPVVDELAVKRDESRCGRPTSTQGCPIRTSPMSAMPGCTTTRTRRESRPSCTDFGETLGKRYLVDFPSPVSYDKCIIFWGVATDKDFRGGTVDEILEIETKVFTEDTPVLEGLEPKEVPLAEAGVRGVGAGRHLHAELPARHPACGADDSAGAGPRSRRRPRFPPKTATPRV